MGLDYFGILLPLIWIFGWIGASILYRQRSGKPLFPRAPEDAIFAEAWRSGRSLRNLLTRIGSARNCLLVYVADRSLTIVPVFPFNLMFLPEIYGLEATASVSEVEVERVKDGLFGKSIVVTVRSPEARRFELWLADQDGFRAALEGRRPVGTRAGGGERPRRPRSGWRSILFRGFAILWGLGALAIGLTGVREDLRFRSQGLAVMGRIAGHTGEAGARNDVGIASYQVAGRTYALVSIRGSGVYRLGATDKLLYMPADPSQAREEEELGFDLLWVFLGGFMLTLGIAFGWIADAFAQSLNVRANSRAPR